MSLKGLPVFINIVELLAFRTPFPTAITKRHEITAPASQVLIITFLTNCHLANSDGLFFSNGIRLELIPIFFFFFAVVDRCSHEVILWIIFVKTVRSSIGTMYRRSRPEVFCKKCSWKFRKIHRKTTVPESPF